MRFALMPLLLAAALPLAATARAGIPADALVSGQARVGFGQSVNGGAWCFLARGPSLFQGSADGTQAVLSLPDITYFDGTTYYALNGQTRVAFTSQTAGTIKFKQVPEYPLTVKNLTFSNYSELDEASNEWQVSFSILFSNCTLPVVIDYETR